MKCRQRIVPSPFVLGVLTLTRASKLFHRVFDLRIKQSSRMAYHATRKPALPTSIHPLRNWFASQIPRAQACYADHADMDQTGISKTPGHAVEQASSSFVDDAF
jgi:hypothetical protein